MKRPATATRRDLLKTGAGLCVAPAFFPGLSLTNPRPERRKTLVLIELFGGVDSLSTLVPGQDDLYRVNRPTLGIPKERLLPIADGRGIPLELSHLHRELGEGRLAILEGVGYPNSSMSHFQARAIVGTAYPNFVAKSSGWIPRLRAHLWGDDPRPELLTHIGHEVVPSMRSIDTQILAFDRPESLDWIASGPERPKEEDEMGGGEEPRRRGDVLEDLRSTVDLSQRLGPRLRQIVGEYEPRAEYPKTSFGRHLESVAAMLEAGFDSRVYSVYHRSFDMHTDAYEQRVQAPLEFNGAIGAFLKDLEGTSADRDTLVLAHTEFGRRLKENSAGGADHGAATLTFFLGANVKGGLHGVTPDMTDLDENGNLKPTVDFRTAYAAVIDRWFGGKHEEVLLEKVAVPDVVAGA